MDEKEDFNIASRASGVISLEKPGGKKWLLARDLVLS